MRGGSPLTGRPNAGASLAAELAGAGVLGSGVTPRTFTELSAFGGSRSGGSPASESSVSRCGTGACAADVDSIASVSSLRTGTAVGDAALPARRAGSDATVSSLRTDPDDSALLRLKQRRSMEAASSVSSLRTDALRTDAGGPPRPSASTGPTPPRPRVPPTPGALTDLTLSTGAGSTETDCSAPPGHGIARSLIPTLPMRQLNAAVPSFVQLQPARGKQCPPPTAVPGTASQGAPSVVESVQQPPQPPPPPPPPPQEAEEAPAQQLRGEVGKTPASSRPAAASPQPRLDAASVAASQATLSKTELGAPAISLDYRDYLEGGREAARVAHSELNTDVGGVRESSRLYEEELHQHLPRPPAGAADAVAVLEARLRAKWTQIERAHDALVALEKDFLETVGEYCDVCGAAEHDQRLERKAAKYMKSLSRSEPSDLPQVSFDPTELVKSVRRLEGVAELLHGEPKRMLHSVVEDVRALSEPLTSADVQRWVSADHVRLESFSRPVALLEDLNHILTVTNAIRVSDVQVALPDSKTCSAPSLEGVVEPLDTQRDFVDSCRAAKRSLETKMAMVEDTRSKISADLLAPSPLIESIQAQLQALLRAFERRCRVRDGDERELSASLDKFEMVQREKRTLLDEKGALLAQQAEDIDRVIALKRQSLYKDLLDRVKVQAEQAKRRREGELLQAVTRRVTDAVGDQLRVLRCRSDGVAAARAVAERQSEFLTSAQKFIASQIGTAMERLHRLGVSAHEHCLEVSLREWQGLELFYSQWEGVVSQADQLRERTDEQELLEAASECEAFARDAMAALKEDFRRVPQWVWRQRTFQALADDDPARFADVRTALDRDEESAVSGNDGSEADGLQATEVWLAHIGALAKGTLTPRFGVL